MKNIKIKEISLDFQEIEDIVVDGQACHNDCRRSIWTSWGPGSTASNSGQCREKVWYDAHWSANR